MDVNAFNAAKTYGAAQRALRPSPQRSEESGAQGGGFSVVKAASALAGAVGQGEAAAGAFAVGKADPHSVVEALAQAELAVETAVTLRNRVVEAYQELLRMPI